MRYASAALVLMVVGCAGNPSTPSLTPDNFGFWTGRNTPADVLVPLRTNLAQCRLSAHNGNTAGNADAAYGSQAAVLPIAADPHLVNPYLISAIGQQQQAKQTYFANIYDCMVAKGYRHF